MARARGVNWIVRWACVAAAAALLAWGGVRLTAALRRALVWSPAPEALEPPPDADGGGDEAIEGQEPERRPGDSARPSRPAVASAAGTQAQAPRPPQKATPAPGSPPERGGESDLRIVGLPVDLPADVRPLPEPLPEGQEPGFRIRGIKGWAWTPEQYLAEIPVLAKYKMNFLMNCYLSLFDGPHGPNRWWEALPAEKRQGFEKVVRACQEQGIQFCFAMHPNFKSLRPLDYGSAEDLDALWQHYAWAQGLGVKWFSICLDDIAKGKEAKGQARVVGEVLRRLRAKDPEAQMAFCPTQYWGLGRGSAYLEELARELPADVYLFWTGEHVFPRTISRSAAESYKAVVKRRLILWDNYPVNDGYPVLHLGPVRGRAPDLGEVVDGYMSNPLYPQNELNRIPLLTCSDYAFNPRAYDPARSIGQAIVHLAETPAQRLVLRDLVQLYPGGLVPAKDPRFHAEAPLPQFRALLGQPDGRRPAEEFLAHVQGLLTRVEKEFPGQFESGRRTIEGHVARMQAALKGEGGRADARGGAGK